MIRRGRLSTALFHRAGHRRARQGIQSLAISLPRLLFLLGLSSAGVAQLVEHLICNQRVGGSNPSASSTRILGRGARRNESWHENRTGWCLWTRVLFVFSPAQNKLSGREPGVPVEISGRGSGVPVDFPGRVGEWLKPADCKSAAPCGLRRFESSPVHQALAVQRARRKKCGCVRQESAGQSLQRDVRAWFKLR